jgi:hypothetical protein
MARKRKTAAEKRAEEAVHEARVQAALRWTGRPEGPDIPAPSFGTLGYSEHISGFAINGIERWEPLYAEDGWALPWQWLVWRVQAGETVRFQPLYSTIERALRDLRRHVEREAATRLEAIDRELAEIEARRARDQLLVEG